MRTVSAAPVAGGEVSGDGLPEPVRDALVGRTMATLTVDPVTCARDAPDFDVGVRSRQPLLPT
jgi:hypothetical protein